jgi:hypothetical protein
MTNFSGDWTTLREGTRVLPYLNGEPYDGEEWLISFTPHEPDVALIEGLPGSRVPRKQIRKANGWELSRV